MPCSVGLSRLFTASYPVRNQSFPMQIFPHGMSCWHDTFKLPPSLSLTNELSSPESSQNNNVPHFIITYLTHSCSRMPPNLASVRKTNNICIRVQSMCHCLTRSTPKQSITFIYNVVCSSDFVHSIQNQQWCQIARPVFLRHSRPSWDSDRLRQPIFWWTSTRWRY